MVIGIAFEGFALIWYLALLANAKPCKLPAVLLKGTMSPRLDCAHFLSKTYSKKKQKTRVVFSVMVHPPSIACLQARGHLGS